MHSPHRRSLLAATWVMLPVCADALPYTLKGTAGHADMSHPESGNAASQSIRCGMW